MGNCFKKNYENLENFMEEKRLKKRREKIKNMSQLKVCPNCIYENKICIDCCTLKRERYNNFGEYAFDKFNTIPKRMGKTFDTFTLVFGKISISIKLDRIDDFMEKLILGESKIIQDIIVEDVNRYLFLNKENLEKIEHPAYSCSSKYSFSQMMRDLSMEYVLYLYWNEKYSS